MITRSRMLTNFALRHLFGLFLGAVVIVGGYCVFVKPHLNSPKPVLWRGNFTNSGKDTIFIVTNYPVPWDEVMNAVSNRSAQLKPVMTGSGRDAILWGGGARVRAVIDDNSFVLHDVIDYIPNHEPNCTLIRYVENGRTNEFHAWLVSVRFENEK